MNKLIEPAKFHLTREDVNSPVWKKLEAHFNDRLNQHRVANDSVTSSVDDTNRLRGRIQELKYLLDLGKPDRVI